MTTNQNILKSQNDQLKKQKVHMKLQKLYVLHLDLDEKEERSL